MTGRTPCSSMRWSKARGPEGEAIPRKERRVAQVATRLALEGGPKTVTVPPGDRWQTISDGEVAAVTEALHGADLYAPTAQLEREFAAFVGTKHALGLCNGTAALHSALFAAGVRAGDEVIVPSYTWHASITPILHCGGTPVFCEVDPDTWTADAADIRRRITPPHPGRGGDPRAGQPGADGRHPGRHPAGGHHGDRGRLARPRRHLRRHAGRRAGRHRLLLAAGEQGGDGHRGRGGHHRPQRPLRADGDPGPLRLPPPAPGHRPLPGPAQHRPGDQVPAPSAGHGHGAGAAAPPPGAEREAPGLVRRPGRRPGRAAGDRPPEGLPRGAAGRPAALLGQDPARGAGGAPGAPSARPWPRRGCR